ncbi:TPA: response regulator transcription factor [Clostridioides difficile]|uniref:response regulator transcription factor n=1 Tax=Clostridioides difficile TaxID=1496 RepID=UPI00097FE58A|nr:response regulator transcription factor [Clostridioides difficile]MCI9996387.1 response regulator transcription factor [Clostridioides difficile]SJO82131.1 Staphylococcal respiratory response protein A [Clostridioides difficile]SJT37063.1 Staphylococcal respiratory response protein A [Clostridioides difficile]HBF4442888.1 response regulator transcription factor [Clostridioides difficile]HBF5454922.1 response regulator transcription factor [Clostridioides difficile]
MYNLLVVDDDVDILNINQIYFSNIGFNVYTSETAKDAMDIVENIVLDCIILDISLPDIDGYKMCNDIKEKVNIPIIFLSNYEHEEEKVRGFLAGGDDYITKPYSLKELELRIYARMRQYKNITSVPNVLKFSALVINVNSRKVTFDGESIDLTTMEFEILLFLAENKEQVFSKIEIYNQVWKMPDIGDQHTVQVHIAQMRKKINSLSREHQYIQTVWGKGYKFVP